MKVLLLQEDSESVAREVHINRTEIIQDLNLEIILKFMARNDKYIYKVARNTITMPLTDKHTILKRQGIVTDTVRNYDKFYKIYEMAEQTLEVMERLTEGAKRANSNNLSNAAIALSSLEMLIVLSDGMAKMKSYLDSIEEDFKSNGMRSLYNRLCEEYNYNFVIEIQKSIDQMNFLTEGGEITLSGTVGQGLKANNLFINHMHNEGYKKRRKVSIITILKNRLFQNNVIFFNDSKLEQEVRELEAASLVHIMRLYQGLIKELMSFFENIHYQMAFYIGAANLQIRLGQMNIPTTMPQFPIKDMDELKFCGLYDLSLAIYNRSLPITNDLETLDMKLFIITGANQGGKSTYLRSIGIAQLLMQCGMFVPAKYYCNKIYDGIFSHFTRREDTAMNSGKLDEELSRMNRILSEITPNSLLLMNESFATTTEREGSNIAQDVVKALYENGAKIIMVTHLFEFTKTMFERKLPFSIFLSAERLPDGTRTYRIYEREPERTSYGVDIYDEIIRRKREDRI